MNIIITFFKYLRRPLLPQRVQQLKGIKTLVVLFLFSMGIDFLIDLFSSSQWMAHLLGIAKIESQEDDVYKRGLLFAIMVVGIIAPILEELSQRAYLTSFIWNNAFLPLNFCIIIVALFNIHSAWGLSITIGISLLISRIIYILILKNNKIKRPLLRFYVKQYWFYFYVSALAFGLLHISNYKIQHFMPALSILLVFPQIFTGLMLGYIRIAMGLKWSACFHILHNLFYVILLFISPH